MFLSSFFIFSPSVSPIPLCCSLSFFRPSFPCPSSFSLSPPSLFLTLFLFFLFFFPFRYHFFFTLPPPLSFPSILSFSFSLFLSSSSSSVAPLSHFLHFISFAIFSSLFSLFPPLSFFSFFFFFCSFLLPLFFSFCFFVFIYFSSSLQSFSPLVFFSCGLFVSHTSPSHYIFSSSHLVFASSLFSVFFGDVLLSLRLLRLYALFFVVCVPASPSLRLVVYAPFRFVFVMPLFVFLHLCPVSFLTFCCFAFLPFRFCSLSPFCCLPSSPLLLFKMRLPRYCAFPCVSLFPFSPFCRRKQGVIKTGATVLNT